MENEHQNLQVRLLGACVIRCPDGRTVELPHWSKKGATLLTYLILHHGTPIPAPRIIRELWGRARLANPESALKTMVSRLRAMLRDISPALSACVISGQSTYRWESGPEVSVDVLEVLDLSEKLRLDLTEPERVACCQRILNLYEGDLYQPEDMLNGAAAVSRLHRVYLDTALALIEIKRKREAWSDILAITDAAMKIDDMDEPLQLERLRALVQMNRAGEALTEYRGLSERERRILDAEPGEELRDFYRRISKAGSTLRYNLDVLRARLTEEKEAGPGPFFCEMNAFREFYLIQMRNLERLGSTMFLGLIMLGDGEAAAADPILYTGAVAALEEILRRNLRRGDIVTRFDDYVIALLLPTVNYQSGTMVMERIGHVFHATYPREKVPFHYRITPLGGEGETS